MEKSGLLKRETLTLKHATARRGVGVEVMFGRKKKASDNIGATCPYCEFTNPLGAETCAQCYYDLNKSARDQPMAEPTTSGEDIMNLLLGDNEDEDDEPIQVVEAVLSLEDVTVDINQYAVAEPQHNEEGEVVPESFEFLGSQGPTLSSTVAAVEDDEVELTAADAPTNVAIFEAGTVDPLAEVAEPVHTGRGGLYSPTVAAPNDDDLTGDVGPTPEYSGMDIPDLPDDEPETPASLTQRDVPFVTEMAAVQPDLTDQPSTADGWNDTALPDLPDDDEPVVEPSSAWPEPAFDASQDSMMLPDLPEETGDETPGLPGDEAPASPEQAMEGGQDEAGQHDPMTVPDLPEDTEDETPALPEDMGDETPVLPDSTEMEEPHLQNAPQRIWPWAKGEAWTPTQVYQEVVKAMECIKHGRMEEGASTLDHLGPHLDVNLDMLLHIAALMQHLGRHDHVKWTLDMAAYVYPDDPYVHQARAQLLG